MVVEAFQDAGLAALSVDRSPVDPAPNADAMPELGRKCLNAFLALVAVLLFALISTRSLVSYLDSIDPDWALAVRGSDARAELKIADDLVARSAEIKGEDGGPDVGIAPDAQAKKQIRDRILGALFAEPSNARGMELLGELAAEAKDTISADAFMQAASKRSLRSPAALYWLMCRRLSQGDVAATIAFADALLRILPASMPSVAPALARIAEMPGGVEAMITSLSQEPPWRESFLRALDGQARNADTQLGLLLGLAKTAHPPKLQEIDAYLRDQIARKNYQFAYYAWLQFLPSQEMKAAGPLFNGNFRFAPSALPFDWTIQGGNGVIEEIAAADEQTDKKVLSIELGGGRVDFRPISQLLILAPGRYHFSGVSKGQLDGPRGLKWQIACVASSSNIVGETSTFLGSIPELTEFSTTFEIPSGCAAQTMRLILDARTTSETLVSGSIIFADLKIERD
jgi:hypothetical protein